MEIYNGPRGALFLMSEVPLQALKRTRMQVSLMEIYSMGGGRFL